MEHNHGLDIQREREEQDGTEWTFGGASPTCILAVPMDKRNAFLPRGELQRGKEDFQDCVSRAYVNILETKFSYHLHNGTLDSSWLEENGYINTIEGQKFVEFSDRFIAIKSNTTKTGNSLKAPVHAVHKYGLIPKTVFPKGDFTWDEYHDPSKITPEMEKVGQEFLKRFPLYYEQVNTDDMQTILKEDLVSLAGFAWPAPKDGEYPRVKNRFNHCFMGVEPQTFIFDNYPETVSDKREWVKKLAPDYLLYYYGYRVYVGTAQIKRNIIEIIWEALRRWLRL